MWYVLISKCLKKTEFYRIEHFQICHKHHKLFLPNWKQDIQKLNLIRLSFFWDTLYLVSPNPLFLLQRELFINLVCTFIFGTNNQGFPYFKIFKIWSSYFLCTHAACLANLEAVHPMIAVKLTLHGNISSNWW